MARRDKGKDKNTSDLEENYEETKPSKKRAVAYADEDDKKAIHREKVRINEQKRRGRLKEYYAQLRKLLPFEQQQSDITKEETLLQAIQLLQNLQARSSTPEQAPVPRHIALSETELSEAFSLVHRDVYHKVFGVNSPESLLSAIAVSDYLCDLSHRSQNDKLLLHAQVCQIAIYGFVAFNPSMCLNVFNTLVPRYEKLTQETPLIQIRPTLGSSEWVLISYSLVLASIGKFDLSATFEKRALQLASKHPEIAANVYANLYFTKSFRGETLSVTEALEAYHCLKKVGYYRDYANLAFALSLMHQNNPTDKQKMEAIEIFEHSEAAILACPYFEFQIRAIFIEMYQLISPLRALKEVELALLLIDKCGRSGCLTRADFLRLKADTLLCLPQETVEERMYNQGMAEELYREAVAVAFELGLNSCSLKAGLSLCKLYRMQRRGRETMELARYLMELLLKLERENGNSPKLMRDVRDFFRQCL